MPGLRVFRSLRPPFVRRREDRTVAGEGSARRAAGADRAPARAGAGTATTPSTRTRKAASSASCWRAVLRVPHLYDMHSSLPQQLTNFAFSRSRLMRRAFLAIERLMIRRSRVVIVICPSLEDTVRGDRPAGADRADRERAGLGRRRGDAARQAARAAIARPGRRRRRWCSTPARSRPTRASICCSRRWRSCRTRGPDARLVLAGGQAGSGRRARATGARGRHRRRHDLCRRAAGRRDSGVSAGGRRAGVAALARHEHAAEDLPVPALGKADRRDAAADAHAGARRRHRDPDRAPRPRSSPTASWRRSPTATRAAAIGRRARQLAETKYSYEAYLERTRQACARADGLDAVSALQATVKDVRREGSGVTEARPLQLHDVRRSRDGPHVRRSAVRRADRRARRQHAGARARQPDRTHSGSRRFSTSAPAPAAPRCCWRAAAPTSRRRRVGARCWRSPAGAPRRKARRVRFRVGDAHALDFPDRSFDVARQPARADAHAPTGGSASPSCAASPTGW